MAGRVTALALAQDRCEKPCEAAQGRRRRVMRQGRSGRCVAGVDVNPDSQPEAIAVVERFGERRTGLAAVGSTRAFGAPRAGASTPSRIAPGELASQQHKLFGERLLCERLIALRMMRGAGQGAREAVHEREGSAPAGWGEAGTGPGGHDAHAVDAWAAKQVQVLLVKAIGVARHARSRPPGGEAAASATLDGRQRVLEACSKKSRARPASANTKTSATTSSRSAAHQRSSRPPGSRGPGGNDVRLPGSSSDHA